MPHHPPENRASAAQDEEYLLRGPEAVLAATLALMTGYAHSCCAAHQGPMAAKVAQQLHALVHSLQHTTGLSCDMQALLCKLHQRWHEAAAQHAALASAEALDADVHGAEADVQALRQELQTQAYHATHAALQPTPVGAALTSLTPEVLWHAPTETLQ